MSETPVATSYEIRPLSMAEILDAGFQLLRRHFLPLAGLGLLGQLPMIGLWLAFGRMLDPFWLQKGGFPEIGATFLVGIGLWLLGMLLLLPIAVGSITAAVSDLYLGAPLSLLRCLERGFARMLPLMFTYVIFMVVLVVGISVVAFAATMLGAAVAALLQVTWLRIALLVVAIMLGVMAMFVLMGLTTVIPGVLAAVVVLEGRSLFDAVLRTFALVYAAIGRMSGIGIVVGFLVAAVGGGVQFTMGSIPIVGALVLGAVQAVSQAYLYTTVVVAYFDVRCRLESFDLEHLAQLVEGSQPSAAPIP